MPSRRFSSQTRAAVGVGEHGYIAAHESIERQTHRSGADRRHRVLQGGRAVPRAGQGGRQRAGGDDRGSRALHHPGDDAGAEQPAGVRLPMGCARAQQHGAHQPGPRGRRDPDCAGQRRFHGQAAPWPRRRPAQPDVSGQTGGDGATDRGPGHEPRDVGQPGDAAQHDAAAGRRHLGAGRGAGRAGLRRNRRRPHAGGRREN